MKFRRYDQLERLNHPEVRDIDVGEIYVFPKLDGTNASVWSDGDHVFAGSRNRTLSTEADNAGFYAWVQSDHPVAVALREVALANPHLIFYGEWLVPHSLRTYREDAWRRFYVFDVYDRDLGRYRSFESYQEILETAGVDYIMPLCKMENPSENQIQTVVERNTYLIQEGAGVGEGVVLKNYQWQNQHGRQPWAKVVRNEFKETNAKIFGVPTIKGEKQTEAEIVHEFATGAWIRKEFAKVVTAVATDMREPLDVKDGTYDRFVAANRHKIIPRTLGTLYYVFVQENARDMIKKFKNPVVDFGKLQKLLTIRVKAVLNELF